jgi:hypothetical protein
LARQWQCTALHPQPASSEATMRTCGLILFIVGAVLLGLALSSGRVSAPASGDGVFIWLLVGSLVAMGLGLGLVCTNPRERASERRDMPSPRIVRRRFWQIRLPRMPRH